AIMNKLEAKNAEIAPEAGDEDAPESLVAGAVAPDASFELKGEKEEAVKAADTDANGDNE
ncbi:MAG: hypothetical protein J5765_00340, partial [Clostridia bacterium]|nr:hypothetical protein [Clostridia bacterium]